MKNYFIYTLLAFTAILHSSCEKVIELDLGDESGQLVIEAGIDNIPGQQIVKLSNNVPFTNTNTYPSVSGAQVSISDQHGHTYTFAESAAGTYILNNVAGVPGEEYNLKVFWNDKTYTAVSRMPEVVTLDSITFAKSEFGDKGRQNISVHYKDPAGIANQYRFILFVNDVQVKDILVDNDDFTDGNQVKMDLRQRDVDIYLGDKVSVEMQCIDKPIYTYWSTLRSHSSNGPGGGVTPSNPPTNISPATLGFFSAYTTSSKTVTLK
jgi:hypothetical protein